MALAVASLVWVTAAEFDFSISKNFVFFVFFGSITGYNFVKYARVAKLYHRSLAKSLKMIQIFSFFCFTALIYFTFQLPVRTILATGFFGLLTLFYALPIFPKQKNLRSLAGIKIFIIAFVWAGVSVILPAIHAQEALNLDLAIEFIQRLLFVVAITLPFEIRDLKFDHETLKTIPQTAGILQTKKFGVLILLLSIAAEFLQDWEIVNTIIYLIIVFISIFLILKSSMNQSKYYASFLVEAVPIIWAILLFCLN